MGQDVCTRAFTTNKDAFNHDGRVTMAMAETVRRMLAGFDPVIAAANIDLAATFTDRYMPA